MRKLTKQIISEHFFTFQKFIRKSCDTRAAEPRIVNFAVKSTKSIVTHENADSVQSRGNDAEELQWHLHLAVEGYSRETGDNAGRSSDNVLQSWILY